MDVKVEKFSMAGSYHRDNGQENQDVVCERENGRYLAVVLADGVSTSRFGKTGAKIAGKVVTEYFVRYGEDLLQFSEEKTAYLLLELVRYHLEKRAKKDKCDYFEFASTLVLCGIDKRNGRMLVMNLGDGAVVSEKTDGEISILPPVRYSGQCCTTTTDKAYKSARLIFENANEKKKLIMLTDGALAGLCGEAENIGSYTHAKAVLSQSCKEIRGLLRRTTCYDDSTVAVLDFV